MSELEDDVYANTEIICIDVETGNGGFYSLGDELSKLFGYDAFYYENGGTHYYHEFNGLPDGYDAELGYVPDIAVPIETILDDMGYLNDDGSLTRWYVFHVDIGADAMENEVPTIEFFDSLKFPLIQARQTSRRLGNEL